MKVEAAIVDDSGVEGRYETNGNIRVDEIELDEPKDHEVLVELEATGVCHSDYHVCTDDAPMGHYPTCLGHEGAGVVQQVGDAVEHVEPGDHVVMSYVPSCGRCIRCAQGNQELCLRSMYLEQGHMMDETFRMHRGDEDIGQFCMLGVMAEATVVHKDSVVKIPDHIPFDAACLTGCGVATGFGAAANRADINAGDTVVHFGFGGVGANAVQGAVRQGADDVIVVDPLEQKREWAEEFGATHTIDPDEEDPVEVVRELTHGALADTSIITVDVAFPETVGQAMNTVGARGETVLISVANHGADHIDFGETGMGSIVGFEKELKGAIYGGWSPKYAIPHLLDMYDNGTLKLDELITSRYSLDGVNDAFDDMVSGNNIRGVIEF